MVGLTTVKLEGSLGWVCFGFLDFSSCGNIALIPDVKNDLLVSMNSIDGNHQYWFLSVGN